MEIKGKKQYEELLREGLNKVCQLALNIFIIHAMVKDASFQFKLVRENHFILRQCRPEIQEVLKKEHLTLRILQQL